MSTKKQEIMEALLDVPVNKLSQKALRWAMSHLPDTDDEGSESKNGVAKVFALDVESVNTQDDNYFVALGLEEPSEEMKEEFNNVLREAHGHPKFSQSAAAIAKYIQKNNNNIKGKMIMAMVLAKAVRQMNHEATEHIKGSSSEGILEKLQSLKALLEIGKELGITPDVSVTKSEIALDQDGNIIKGSLPENMTEEQKQAFQNFLDKLKGKKTDDTE